MGGASLAVERMSDAGLWRRLKGTLAILDPQSHPINAAERARKHGAYREARAIVAELEMRGVQLELDV